VSNTTPIPQLNLEEILNTSIAGEYLGKQIIYLEAGSGAVTPVDPKIIRSVSENIDIPIIVGGGIRTKQQLRMAFDNGADLVVIGTAFENNNDIFNTIV
jgi:putative glycerol-1-phosphate prenyltransferase